MRQLYHTSFSPGCRRIRCMLDEIGLEYELVEEPVWEQRRELFELNPAGNIPVLIDANGLILCGVYVIGEYLEEGYQLQPPLLGETLAMRAEVRRLTDWADTKIRREVTQPLLHEKFFRQKLKAGQPDTKRIRQAKGMMTKHVEYLEGLLAEQTWLAGEHYSLADISVAAHISLFDYLNDIPWKRNAPLKRWYALVKSRPAFRRVLQDRVRGIKPPEHYEDPDF